MRRPGNPAELSELLNNLGYVTDPDLATTLFLLIRLGKPLLLEGPPGVGKTEVALALSQLMNTSLIRLQCHEGLDIHSAVYEWNYQKQLLGIRLNENDGRSGKEKEKEIFSDAYLLKRPLLEAITRTDSSPVLLIDELDRSDEEFEAFLLELLSAFQVTIPELGTIRATLKPWVILTSNRTRELSDALRRRCLYHWIDYPSSEKESSIVRKRMPQIGEELLQQVVSYVQDFRTRKLNKTPGVSETIDWAESLMALGYKNMSREAAAATLGAVLKSNDDLQLIRTEWAETLPV